MQLNRAQLNRAQLSRAQLNRAQLNRAKYLAMFVLALAAAGIEAKTVTVQVGGTTTSGGDGYGYGGSTTPVLVFDPPNQTINVGDTITWTNLGGAQHNVHADDNSFRCANGCDGTGGNGTPSAMGWTASVTFTKPGVVSYHCDVHGAMGMTGTITVNAAATTMNLGGYLSGNWFNPGQGGHGFQLEFTNRSTGATTSDMVAIWFVYTPTGSAANDGSGQNWIFAEGDYDTTKNTVTLPAILLTGAKFPPNFNAADVRRVSGDASTTWGTITFTFSDCNNGTVSWHANVPGYTGANDVALPIQRLTQIAGTTCPQ
jgi:plastocyanin